jgi:hypothetical protein
VGVLTDYFRAADRDAARALIAEREFVPLADTPGLAPVDGVEAKGIDPFVVLPALVAAVPGAPAESDGDAPLVWPDADDQEALAEGPWVVELSEEARDVLASLAPQDAGPVADRWATADELDGSTGEDLLPFVVDLAALARRAADAGDRLYCWTCL